MEFQNNGKSWLTIDYNDYFCAQSVKYLAKYIPSGLILPVYSSIFASSIDE